VRARHARFFADLADAMFDVWRSPRQLVASEWCAREMDNLRLAFTWSADGPDRDAAIRLAASIGDIARFQFLHEASTWADSILEAARAVRSPRLGIILTWAASNAWGLGHYDEAERFGLEAIALADEPDFDDFVWAFVDLATVAVRRGQADRAVELARRGAAHPADERDRLCLAFLAWLLAALSRHDEALRVLDESIEVIKGTGIPLSISMAEVAVGAALAPSDPRGALEAYERAIDAARDGGVTMLELMAIGGLAELHVDQGDHELALRHLDVMLTRSGGSMDEGGMNLGSLAIVLAGVGWSEPAATILGWWVPRTLSDRYGEVESRLRSALGDEGFEACVAAGAGMTRTEMFTMAVDQARRCLDELLDTPGSTPTAN